MINMFSFTLNTFALPMILAATAVLALGIAALLYNRLSGTVLSFLFFVATIVGWLGGIGVMYLANDRGIARIFASVVFGCVSFIPLALYLLTLNLTAWRSYDSAFFPVATTISIGYSLSALLTSYSIIGVYEYAWGFYPRYSSLVLGYLVAFCAMIVRSLYLLFRATRDAPSDSVRYQRYRTLAFATFIAVFASVDFLPTYGYSVYPFGYVFILGYSVLTAWTIWQYRLDDSSSPLVTSAVFSTMTNAAFVFDSDGNVELVNEAARDLFDVEANKLPGEHINDLFDLGQRKPFSLMRTDEQFEGQSRGNQRPVQVQVLDIGHGHGVEGGILIARDQTEKYEKEQQLRKFKFHNPETGLPNERYLHEEHQGASDCVYIHVENRNRLSQKHEAVDEEIAARIEEFQDGICFAHPETDGYAVLYDRGIDTLEDDFEKRLQSQPLTIDVEGQQLHLRTKVGIARGETTEKALRRARLTAHQSTISGWSVVETCSTEKEKRARRTEQLNQGIEQALNNRKLSVYYHPQFTSSSLQGAEALIRWNHPDFGFVPPPDIIEAVNTTGLQEQFLDYVLHESLGHYRQMDEVLETISVNVSAAQLRRNGDFVEQVQRALFEQGVASDELCLEVTETSMVNQKEMVRSTLEALRQYGVKVAIDDFGTGHATLEYLSEFPASSVKIDKSFIMDLHENSRHKQLVRGILGMARELGIKTVAEGVEREEHFSILSSHGCDSFQGYHWTKPLPFSDFTSFAEKQQHPKSVSAP